MARLSRKTTPATERSAERATERAAEQPAVVALEKVRKTYVTVAGEVTALRGIDLVIEAGEFVSIMGPSGSGKSTLMNIIGLLDRLTTGRYLLNGYNVEDYDEVQLSHLRAQSVGFVFQSFNLLPRTSVLQNVVLPMEYTRIPRRERQKRAAEALERVGLSRKFYHHLSNEISGGQMQRVAIARALVNEPSLILADEPTGNLDRKTGNAVLEMFSDLHDQGATIVLITHDLKIASHAKRTVSILDGKLFEGVFTGDEDELVEEE